MYVILGVQTKIVKGFTATMRAALRSRRPPLLARTGKKLEGRRSSKHFIAFVSAQDRLHSFTTDTATDIGHGQPVHGTKVEPRVNVKNKGNSTRKMIQDAVKSNDIEQAYELLCIMMKDEQTGDHSSKLDFDDFSTLLWGTRHLKGRKYAEIATNTLEQLKIRIDEKKLVTYRHITEHVNNVLKQWMTCTTAPARVKLKNVRDIFNVSQLVTAILQDVEDRPDFVPSLTTFNIVLTCHVNAAIAASQARKRGEDLGETLQIATLSAKAAEELLVRMIESPDEKQKPNIMTYKSILTAWANVPSLEGIDRILAILETMEDHFGLLDAYLYGTVFNALAQAAPLVEFDPTNPNVPANRAVALLRRLLSPLKHGGRTIPLNAMCYASAINVFAKSVALRDLGELAPANLAEACLRQYTELYQIGLMDEGPDDYCYGNVIAAWIRHADVDVGALKAEAILCRLETHMGDKVVREEHRERLTTWYNMVLHAFSRSTLNDAPERAEAILCRMESALIADKLSYEAVISTWAKNPHVTVDRAERANLYLSRMKIPHIMCYNTALAACAANAPEFAENGLLIAEKLFAEMDSPNGATYGRIMSVYNMLLSNDHDEREKRLELVFRQCCEHGQVNKLNLSVFKTGISKAGFERLLGKQLAELCRDEIDLGKLPRKWLYRGNRKKGSDS